MADDYKCYADAAKLAGLELLEPEEGSVKVKHRTFGPGRGNITDDAGDAIDISYTAKGRTRNALQYVTFSSSRDPAGVQTDKIVTRNGFLGTAVGIARSNGEVATKYDGDAPKISEPKNISAAVAKALTLCQ